jgi:putative hydrolase of the HAD superfamily
VFELILRREHKPASQLVYIGDDPSKDFRGLRPLGVHTIRVRTGRHATVAVPADEDAELTVPDINGVPALVAELEAA